LTATNGPLRRAERSWIVRATSSFPVPLSPWMRIVAELSAPARRGSACGGRRVRADHCPWHECLELLLTPCLLDQVAPLERLVDQLMSCSRRTAWSGNRMAPSFIAFTASRRFDASTDPSTFRHVAFAARRSSSRSGPASGIGH